MLTVSIGGATMDQHSFDSAEDLFAVADQHLYLAKQQGRNRIVWRAPASSRLSL